MLKLYILAIILSLIIQTIYSSFEFSKGRRWYFGGEFNEVVTESQKTIIANNFAFLDSSGEFYTLGNGTNGPVHAIHVDLCMNVYIGGNFTTVDGIETGPIAKYDYFYQRWVALASLSSFDTSNGAIVRSITSNCFHFGFCTCDVFFGGKFILTDGKGEIAKSLAMYDSESNNIVSLSQSSWNSNPEIYALYKKNFGVTVATTYLWVGGENLGTDIYFGRLTLGDRSWKEFSEVNGIVRSFEYISGTIGIIDKLFISGDFDFTSQSGVKCKYICEFAHNTFKWSLVSNDIDGPIYSIKRDENTLYISGNFTNRVAKIVDKFPMNIDLSQSDYIPQNKLIHSIDVCSRLDLACKGGSISAASNDGLITFFNARKNRFDGFGKEVKGTVNVITSSFQFRNSSSKLTTNFFVITIIIILSCLFLI